jgi:hypothetical protein
MKQSPAIVALLTGRWNGPRFWPEAFADAR